MTRAELYQKIMQLQGTDGSLTNQLKGLLSSITNALQTAAEVNDQDAVVKDFVLTLYDGNHADLPTPPEYIDLVVALDGVPLSVDAYKINGRRLEFQHGYRPAVPEKNKVYLDDLLIGVVTVSYTHAGCVADVEALLTAFPDLALAAVEFNNKVAYWQSVAAQLAQIITPKIALFIIDTPNAIWPNASSPSAILHISDSAGNVGIGA